MVKQCTKAVAIDRSVEPVRIFVAYGWQKDDDTECTPGSRTKDRYWAAIKELFLRACEGVQDRTGVRIEFQRLRASHGSFIWTSVLEKIANADIMIVDLAKAPTGCAIDKATAEGLNSNALVELGASLALKKKTIIMCPNDLKGIVPSDIAGYMLTLYDGAFMDGKFCKKTADTKGIVNNFRRLLEEAVERHLLEAKTKCR